MDTADLRRANLRQVIAKATQSGEAKTLTAFCAMHELNVAYLSQILNNHGTFGERAARNLEAKIGLAPKSLDKELLSSFEISDRSLVDKPMPAGQSVNSQQMIFNPVQQYADWGLSGCKSGFARVSEIDGVRYVPIVGDATMGPDGFYLPYSDDGRTGDGYLKSIFAGPFSYALRGVGGCMHPAVRDGWFVVFDPEEPPCIAEYVHVALLDGRQTIKEFLGVQGNLVTLLAVNEMRRISIPVSEIQCVSACIEIMPPSRRLLELPMPMQLHEYQDDFSS